LTINSRFPVVIPAAGIGSRMAAKQAKQYLPIQDKTILEHTLDLFLSQDNIGPIVVVLHPEDQIFEGLSVAAHANIHTVIGGQERVDSVLAGLSLLQDLGYTNHFVLVHDAARPCLEKNDLNKLINECLKASAKDEFISGAILACPVADTIKKSLANKGNNTTNSAASIIESTVNRTGLWQAQTPQMFEVDELSKAIEIGLAKGYKLTDEASAIECIGKKVLLVEGPSSNIKITRPSDLPLALFYLSNRKSTIVT
jgi:2-C-methyl-D-erythritol 4-phosphate cytidylyltransferase